MKQTGIPGSEFDKKSSEIDKAHQQLKTPPDLEEQKKILQDTIDSIDIMVPLMKVISLENVSASPHKEIKLIELSSQKQIQYERLAIKLEAKSADELTALQDDLTFDSMIDFEQTELTHLYNMVILICDNGLNLDEEGKGFVTLDFCENVLSRTLIYKILVTYMKEFATQALMERMKLINFLAMPVMLSSQPTRQSSGESG